MNNLIEKIKLLATKKNVSIADIRDCIGNDRFYRISEGKSDLPLNKLINVAELLNLSDDETLWLIKGTSEEPEPQKKIGIDIVLNEIGSLRQEIADLKEEIKQTPPSHTKSQEAEVEKEIALKLKKPVPP